jgi:Phytanoyl-CoA dioxygenase (PhyH)
MTTSEELLSTLDRDGFVIVSSFLDERVVDEARRDLEAIYTRDLEERRMRNAEEASFSHGSTKTVLTPPSHLALRLPGRSKALDQCFEKIFTDPLTSKVLRGMAGEHVKIRDVNCRQMTGTIDDGDFLNPPHEWHRDSLGEFGIGVFLNEVPSGDNAGTAVVPGSHKYPWCARWNVMFGDPLYLNRKGLRGPKLLARFNIFSRLLHHFYVQNKKPIGVPGKPGDIYFFVNDIWHGRVPNLHGRRGMVVLAGGFPTDFPFPDSPDPFPDDIIKSVPPTYGRALARDLPINTDKNTVIHRMLANRRPDSPSDLFWWARKERELLVAMILPVAHIAVITQQKFRSSFYRLRFERIVFIAQQKFGGSLAYRLLRGVWRRVRGHAQPQRL